MIKVNQGRAGLDSQYSRQEKAGFGQLRQGFVRLCRLRQSRQGKAGYCRFGTEENTKQGRAGLFRQDKAKQVCFWAVKARLCRAEQI